MCHHYLCRGLPGDCETCPPCLFDRKYPDKRAWLPTLSNIFTLMYGPRGLELMDRSFDLGFEMGKDMAEAPTTGVLLEVIAHHHDCSYALARECTQGCIRTAMMEASYLPARVLAKALHFAAAVVD